MFGILLLAASRMSNEPSRRRLDAVSIAASRQVKCLGQEATSYASPEEQMPLPPKCKECSKLANWYQLPRYGHHAEAVEMADEPAFRPFI